MKSERLAKVITLRDENIMKYSLALSISLVLKAWHKSIIILQGA